MYKKIISVSIIIFLMCVNLNVFAENHKKEEYIVDYAYLTERSLYDSQSELTALSLDNDASFDTCFRNQLDSNSKILYDFVLDNYDTLKKGTQTITFTNDGSYNFTTWEQVKEDFSYAMGALNFDHNEFYWFKITKVQYSRSYNSSNPLINFTIKLKDGYSNYYLDGYTSEAQVNADIQKMNTEINKITLAVSGKSRYEKILYFNEYLVKKNEYNTYIANGENNKAGNFPHTAVSALVYGNTDLSNPENPVCEGYSRALKLLCDKVGIPCILVSGKGHMWNAVQMEDGKWYCMDSTYNDPVISGNPTDEQKNSLMNRYTLVGTETLIGGKAFSSDHIPEGGFLVGSTNECIYPVFSKTKYVPSSSTTELSSETTTESTTESTTEYTTITEYPLGDIDNDRILTAADAAAALNLFYKLSLDSDYYISEKEFMYADIDQNGKIEKKDAEEILKKVLTIYNNNVNNNVSEDE